MCGGVITPRAQTLREAAASASAPPVVQGRSIPPPSAIAGREGGIPSVKDSRFYGVSVISLASPSLLQGSRCNGCTQHKAHLNQCERFCLKPDDFDLEPDNAVIYMQCSRTKELVMQTQTTDLTNLLETELMSVFCEKM